MAKSKRFRPTANKANRTSTQPSHQISTAIIATTLLCIAAITLFPYDFFFVETIADFTWEKLLARAHRPILMPLEFIANILMFVPLGLGCALKVQKKTLAALMTVLGLSLAITLTIECLQIFLPSRTPSHTDLIANTLGGGLGFVLWQYWQPFAQSRWASQLLNLRSRAYNIVIAPLLPYWQIIKPRPKTQRRLIAIALCSYCTLSLWGTAHLRSANPWSLSNWDPNYPLLLGNELEGDRPWRGQLSNVQIYAQQLETTDIQQLFDRPERALEQASPIAHYPLSGMAPFADQADQLPDLIWQGESPATTDQSHTAQFVSFRPQQWLETKSPPTALIQQLKSAKAFTISLTAETASQKQTGPARILSLSQGPFYRNLTIGQNGSHLSLRLRTPITKDNGQRPEFFVPNVFSSIAEPHHLILTYSADQLALYADTLSNAYTLQFSPEMTLFWQLAPPFLSTVHLNSATSLICQLLYRGLWFFPIGIILSSTMTPQLKKETNYKQFQIAIIAIIALFYGLLEILLH